MHANPSALDNQALAACLRASAGEERHRQVDFLLYLDPFDSRGAYREAGYGSLWQYCLGELALREGAAGRRIGAMRALREFPALEAPLRDGRLSLTTAVTLRPVLTEENLDEMVARAAHKTDEETRQLVAALQPRPGPREGIRRLPDPAPRLPERRPLDIGVSAPPVEAEPEPFVLAAPPRPASRPSLEPISAEQWSVRVTIDAAFRVEIETLRCLLSHKLPDGDLAAVLREAVRCAIEKHGKRRGAAKPQRERKPVAARPPRPGERDPVPAAVRRAVWERDSGRCTYASPDGHRCDGRWRLEIDHIRPVALGGPSTVENLRLRCRSHNALHADESFGRETMARFRGKKRSKPRTGELAIASDSDRVAPAEARPASGE